MADRNYALNISVSSRSEGGSTRSESIRNEGRRRTQDHAESMRKRLPAGSVPKDPQTKSTMALSKQVGRLIAVQEKILRQLMVMNKRGGPGGGGGGAQPRGGGTPMGTGARGLGSVGASLPYVGAAIAGAGYIINKVLEVGHRNIEVSSRQFRSAGIGGFQAGAVGAFGPTDLGAFAREQAIARGRMGRGAVTRENAGYALQMAELTGMDAGTMGRLQGLLGGSRRGGGEQRLREIVRTTGGVGAQTPEIMNMILDRMSEAVSEGIDDSDIGPQIAKNLAPFVGQRGAAGVRSVGAAMRNAQSAVSAVQRGQQGGVMGFMLRSQATREIAASPELQKKYGIKDMNQMSPYEMEGILQRYISENPQVKMSTFRSIYEKTGRNKNMFRTALQGVYSPNTTVQQADILAEQFERERKSPWMAGGPARADTTQQAIKNMGQVGVRQRYQAGLDVMALSKPAQKAADVVLTLNRAMIDLAGTGAGSATVALTALNGILKELSKTAVGSARDLSGGNYKGLLEKAGGGAAFVDRALTGGAVTNTINNARSLYNQIMK